MPGEHAGFAQSDQGPERVAYRFIVVLVQTMVALFSRCYGINPMFRFEDNWDDYPINPKVRIP